MAKLWVEEKTLTAIGDAIRAKNGTSEKMSIPNGMVNAIQNIETGVQLTRTTNLLKDSRCAVHLNKTVSSNSIVDGNGRVVVAVPLALINPVKYDGGFTAVFRWRGLSADADYGNRIYGGTGETISAGKTYLANQSTVDEYGDFCSPPITFYGSGTYDQNTYAYVLLCRKTSVAITETDIENCILTVNEPIGYTSNN